MTPAPVLFCLFIVHMQIAYKELQMNYGKVALAASFEVSRSVEAISRPTNSSQPSPQNSPGPHKNEKCGNDRTEWARKG